MSNTSSAPFDTAPEASLSSLHPPPVLIASLASLPIEVKARIVAHVDHFSVRHDQARITSSSSSVPRRSDSLSALASVDSVFHELCAPYFWNEFGITDHSDELVIHVIEHPLPTVGHLVKSFTFLVLGSQLTDESAALDRIRSTRLSVVEAAERLFRSKSSGVDFENRQLRSRNLLMSTALRFCPYLEELELHAVSGCPLSEITSAVVHGGTARITTLNLRLIETPASSVPIAVVAAMISACPLLESLALDHALNDNAPESLQPLYTVLARCESLRLLEVGGAQMINDDFLALTFINALERVDLMSWPNQIPLSAFRTFLAQHADSLTGFSVGLNIALPAEGDRYLPLALSQLRDLDLNTEFIDAPLLELFDSAPVQAFAISEKPLSLSLDQLLRFLDRHRATAELEALGKWCEEGVDFFVAR